MLGPSYGEWWKERPGAGRMRIALIALPFVAVAAWALYLALGGARPSDALFEAVARGDREGVRTELARGTSPNARRPDGTTPLHWALEYGHRDLAALLVREGSEAGALDVHGVSALHRAASLGDEALARLLLEHGADPNASSPLYGSPLHWAAVGGHRDLLRLLLDAGASPDPRDDGGRTPLQIAVLSGHREAAHLLRARGADPDVRDARGRTLLHQAALARRTDVAALLLELGSEVDARDAKGNTALHHAAHRGASELAALLVSRGADPSTRTPDLGVTPLHLASRHAHQETMHVLLRNGAPPHPASRLYGTPLHWAAEHGRLEAVRTLLAYGAPADLRDDHGLTAAERARTRGHHAVAELLARISHHPPAADADHEAVSGCTPSNHFDMGSAMPSVFLGPCTRSPRRLDTLATKAGEKSGLEGAAPRLGTAPPPLRPAALAGRERETGCTLPETLHGASRTVLLHYVEGTLPNAEFRRLFSLPNSEYLALGACLSARHEPG